MQSFYFGLDHAVGQKVNFIVYEVDGRLDINPKLYQFIDELVDLIRKYALHGLLGRAYGLFRTAGDQIGDGFGLSQVNFIV